MYWSALGVGLSVGVLAALTPIVLFLPTSYIMNTFIYHNWGMRIMLGLLVSYFPVLSLVVVALLRIFAGWKPASFFGLLPLYSVSEDLPLPGGYFTFVYRIFYSLIDPFISYENMAAYRESINHFLVEENSPSHKFGDRVVYKYAVPEFFFKATRDAGKIEDKTKWTEYMKNLEMTGIGRYVFGPDDPVELEAKKESA